MSRADEAGENLWSKAPGSSLKASPPLVSYRSINSILKNGLDDKPLEEEPPVSKPMSHPNIPGSAYYEGESSC